MLKLDAINTCLRYVGETSIPDGVDLDSLDSLHQARIIDSIIDSKSKEVQTGGLWFNVEDWEFLPDANNRIGVPPNVLELETDGGIILRGGSLYDTVNKTYEFTDKVSALVTWEWDFEELPQSVASLITYLSAQQAQILFIGDTTTDRELQRQIDLASLAVKREDIRQHKPNLISGNRLVNRSSKPSPVI